MKHIGRIGFSPFNTFIIYRDEKGEWYKLGLGFYWLENKANEKNGKTSKRS